MQDVKRRLAIQIPWECVTTCQLRLNAIYGAEKALLSHWPERGSPTEQTDGLEFSF